jgi:hypothetical protein
MSSSDDIFAPNNMTPGPFMGEGANSVPFNVIVQAGERYIFEPVEE